MKNIRALVVIAALPMLGGCVAALVGGAVGTGVVVANDRRTVGTVTEDEAIEIKAASRVSDRVKDAHINFTSYNRLVLLTGEVPNQAARDDAERITRGVENVRGVYNELQVAGNSAYSSRTNDAYLTSKVKARFVDSGGKFNPVQVKVVTENSVVYLMGIVTRAEGEAATEIARTTGGVQKVVRLFEYID
jgi:osmotically-inducible protein OsmY